jgi:hypothetical protein
VERPPTLSDDDVYREVIKALAYAPKGTIFALESALTAFFGLGNYELWEDLITCPNTVFISLADSVSLASTPVGSTYLGKSVPLLYDDVADTLTLPETPVGTVQGAPLQDEIAENDLTVVLPSAITEIRFDGDAGIPIWTFSDESSGTAEGVEVVANFALGGGETALRMDLLAPLTDEATYTHPARIQPESEACIDVTIYIASETGAGPGFFLDIRDGARQIRMAFHDAVAPGFFDVGADNAGTLFGTTLSLAYGVWHTFQVRKRALDGAVVLSHNGVDFSTIVDDTLFAATTETAFAFGCDDAAAGGDFYVQNINYFAETLTDYLNSRGVAADVLAASPTVLDTNSGILISADEGSAIRVFGGVAVNPEGGLNNGSYLVDSVLTGDNADLVGPTQINAFVETAHPARLTAVANPTAFRYPEDQGKTLEILGAGPSAGDVLITHVLDPVAGYPVSGVLEEVSDQVLAVGPTTGQTGATGSTSTANPDRFIDLSASFAPTVVGKLLVIRSATNPVNVGVFLITARLSGEILLTNSVDIGQSWITESTISWEIHESTGWVTETGLDYRVKPNFVDETGLGWELSGTADVTGAVVTLRQDPPFDFSAVALILRATYSMVLSAQLLPDEEVAAEAIPATDPVEYTYYPFYMPASPLGAFEAFIDELTVAGVIPEITF